MTPPTDVERSPSDPGVAWVDSHCHLQEQYLGEEPGPGAVADALDRCRAAGVEALVCVGTDAVTSAQALALARATRPGPRVPEVRATVGLHPHEASQGTAEVVALAVEARAAGDGALVAVGECGLDYHYEHSPRAEQRRAFAEQVGLAHRLDLALVVHARDAWDDLFAVLESEGVPPRAILHCFTGGPDELDRCVEAGLHVSFSGIVTFKNADPVRAAAARCPLDRLLVETDSPFLAPVPHRGRPNEPAYVSLVGAAVAELRSMPAGDLAARTASTTRSVFAW